MRRDVAGVGRLGSEAHSWALHAFPLVLLSFPARNDNCERGCEGKLIQRSRVEVVEGGFPHISVRGYMIISKVKI